MPLYSLLNLNINYNKPKNPQSWLMGSNPTLRALICSTTIIAAWPTLSLILY